MNRLVLSAVVLGALVAMARAQPTTSPSASPPQPAPAAPAPAAPAPAAPAPAAQPAPARPAPGAKPGPATLPAVGELFAITGTASWPKLDWLYDVPSPTDAAGKVMIHWFCAPKAPACTEDLARIVTLKENGRVYVVAYINGSKAQARKLDPIRESEGVGRGTVAFGRGATKLMKDLKITGPASIVVDVEGKVQLVTTGATPAELDARDAKVNAATGAIKEYVSASEGPKLAKPGDKFALSMTIKLASWLKYSDKTPMELKVTVPPDIKCDATTLRSEQMKIADKQLTASVTCSGPRGIYEARGELRFGYDAPGGGTGLGAESAKWTFEIKS
jgi:hypothetical protein